MAGKYGPIFSVLMTIHSNSCSGHTNIPTISLFTIVTSQNQPRCCPTDEWIKKMCYVFTIFGYKDKIMSFTEKWVILKTTTQREIKQHQKDKYCGFSHIQNLDFNSCVNLSVYVYCVYVHVCTDLCAYMCMFDGSRRTTTAGVEEVRRREQKRTVVEDT